jgi:hypothetical protein
MAYESVFIVVAAAPSATCLAFLGREALRWRRGLAESERELARVRRQVAKRARALRPAVAR